MAGMVCNERCMAPRLSVPSHCGQGVVLTLCLWRHLFLSDLAGWHGAQHHKMLLTHCLSVQSHDEKVGFNELLVNLRLSMASHGFQQQLSLLMPFYAVA